MSEIHDVGTYSPKAQECFFFDNNIWMLLYCPIGNHNKKKQRVYSSFLNQILQRGGVIFINSLVLSEFYNASLKLDYYLWAADAGNHGKDYKKDYLKTQRAKEMVSVTIDSIAQILKVCQRGNDDFNAIRIDNVMNCLKFLDFNDSYYVELCQNRSWKIVTEDKDIFSSVVNLHIITVA